MRRVMRHTIRHNFVLQREENEVSHKRSFMRQAKKLALRVCCRFWPFSETELPAYQILGNLRSYRAKGGPGLLTTEPRPPPPSASSASAEFPVRTYVQERQIH